MNRAFSLLVLLAASRVGWSQACHAQTPPALRFSGDFRLRYEYTSRGNGAPTVDKEVVRLRAGITYPVRDDVMVRARVATGSPGDPNSTDITLGQFVDDLSFTVDVASVELNRPHWGVFGGKFTNPFLTTELVWDGDVNPQGLGGRLKLGGKDRPVTGTLTALYFVVDQQAGDSGSDMAGGQLAVSAKAGPSWRFTAAAAYYDYRIRSLVNGDGGDFRGNRVVLGPTRPTAYLSDFDLVDAMVTADYAGFGERFPLRVVGEYVHNAGADDLNTGWGADLYVGRLTRPGETRWRYGYALAETDAILAAFAHDNTTLGTNSETHTLAVDAVPIAGLLLNATWYFYRPHEAARRQYQTRLRLNATVTW